MNRATVVAALLRLYPRAWRNEYGAELADMLLASPLSARTIGDVLWNGLRHRARATEPWVYLGLIGFVWIWQDWPLLRFYAIKLHALYAFCGFWMSLRSGRIDDREACVRLTLLASPPLVIQTILAVAGYLPPQRWLILEHAPLLIALAPLFVALTCGPSMRTGAWFARKLLRRLSTDR